MSANETQVGGSHYKGKTIQPWDYIAANELGYFEGNIVKYISRWQDKGGVDDLKKARHYLDKLIELKSASKEGLHRDQLERMERENGRSKSED